MNDLQNFLDAGVFAFMLCFVRVGTAIMLMPGIGSTYVPGNVRLYFALALSFVLFPLFQSKIPHPLPDTFLLFTLIVMEFVIGLLFGTVSRILMSALDTAGLIVATQSSLANAQLFNPAMASQGSIVGVFMTLAGLMLFFTTDLHHLVIMGIIKSYDVFPIGQIPDFGSVANFLSRALGSAFAVGIQITAPFMILILMLNIGMGVMSKLMPQIQVFMLAVPIQVTVALVTLMSAASLMMMVWLNEYEKGMSYFLSGLK